MHGCLELKLGNEDSAQTFPEIEKDLERLKWNLWHGNVHKALQIVEDLEFGSDLEELSQEQRKCKRLTIPTCSSASFVVSVRVTRNVHSVEHLAGQGYRLTDVSGYNVGGQARYAAIWEKSI